MTNLLISVFTAIIVMAILIPIIVNQIDKHIDRAEKVREESLKKQEIESLHKIKIGD